MPLFAAYEPRSGAHAEPDASITVRDVTSADVEPLAAIALERHDDTLEEERNAFEHELECLPRDGRRRLLVAELDGRVAGYGRLVEFRPQSGAPSNTAPAGWYLTGVVVAEASRRRGVATALTRDRLEIVAEHASVAYYFANAHNLASIDLHARLGFRELTRDFTFPRVSFDGGTGILFHARLRSAHRRRR